MGADQPRADSVRVLAPLRQYGTIPAATVCQQTNLSLARTVAALEYLLGTGEVEQVGDAWRLTT